MIDWACEVQRGPAGKPTLQQTGAPLRRHKARAIELAAARIKVAATAVHPVSRGAAIAKRGCLGTLVFELSGLGVAGSTDRTSRVSAGTAGASRTAERSPVARQQAAAGPCYEATVLGLAPCCWACIAPSDQSIVQLCCNLLHIVVFRLLSCTRLRPPPSGFRQLPTSLQCI